MKFDIKDSEELRKIGVVSLLDLALMIPKGFDDLRIKDEPNEGENVVEIECKFQRKNGSMLIVTAFCLTWQCEIKIIIFNAKGWHYGTFKSTKRMHIHEKSHYAHGVWQFVNPKVVSKIGQILPRYKSAIRDAALVKFIEKYLNLESLLGEGLFENEAQIILNLHQNSQTSINLIKNLQQNPTILYLLKFIEIYNYMKKLSRKKHKFPSKKIEIYDIKGWIANLPFTPTDDQQQALLDIKRDFLSDIAARRVVMGDVGSGKTFVMLGAALMNYPRISYLMAPTTILAEQIYNEACKLLPKFMKIKLLKSGDDVDDFRGLNLIIGTHTLLFRDLEKSNLIMVDEQHRFGSNQRERINELTKDDEFRAHYIQFSATPIPRTLSLINSEIVNFSFLKQMPYKKDIKTFVIQNAGFDELITHIKNEILKENQVAIIYPLVDESDVSNYQSLAQASEFWQKKFKNVYITHGKDKNKEEILRQFRDSGSLLLATTLVEVGISLPKLSTIVVVGAEKLGLATLHQLRGRVGRQGGEGWCFLFTKLKKPPNRLLEFAKTLDGFEIASLDLKNRQAGDLLDGTAQHGQTFVWFEMEEHITKEAKDRLDMVENIYLGLKI